MQFVVQVQLAREALIQAEDIAEQINSHLYSLKLKN
jgi:hypothetical protein